ITLAQTCDEWAVTGSVADDRRGLLDSLDLARPALAAPQIALADQIAAAVTAPGDGPDWPAILRLSRKAGAGLTAGPDQDEARFWVGTLQHRAEAALAPPPDGLAPPHEALALRLHALATQARAMAMAMDFRFLLDPERKLLSIGHSAEDNTRDQACYDLLASEARRTGSGLAARRCCCRVVPRLDPGPGRCSNI
ncbi:MAG: hypothetical protein ACK4YU_14005, partial [Paracoccus sp. (in: a-proteobacteria)]